ncbi:MAG: HEPN domain-containing protein [Acetobacter pasteurianus]
MIQPQDFLDAAESALSIAHTEVQCRSAIHLAYYAVFHMVAAHLERQTTGDNSVKHRELARLLRMNTKIDPVLYEAKRNFSRLMTLRFRADYYLNEDIGINDANDALDWAYAIFDAKVKQPVSEKLKKITAA